MLSFQEFMQRMKTLSQEILGLKAEAEHLTQETRVMKEELVSEAKLQELRSNIDKT